jgi:isoamyl acetate esterase
MSPPPLNKYQRGGDPDRNFETTRAYANAVKEVAHAKGVAFVDVWMEMWQAAGADERALSRYLIDGLHPNAEGYRVIKCS